jgi:HK97 family phage prohead protease
MLFQHDPKEPVGTWERLVDDGFGLWVEGRLVGGVPRADALRRLIASGAIDGLSIGFRTVRATRDPRSRHRRLWQIDLWEISIVTFPMLAGARISAGGRLAPAPDGRLLRSLDAAISALKTS